MNNNEIEKILKNSVNNKKVLHSYMFVGSKYTDKKKIANKFAKHILCNSKEDKACERCKSCIEMNSGNHPDFNILELQNSENSIKIEQIRKIQEDIIKKPIISEKKIYIINNAEKMTIGAQNCLLKTLEEPSQYVTIILLVEDENLILNTIKSRCTKILFLEETINDLTEEEKEIYTQLEKIFANINSYEILDVLNKLDVLYKNEKRIFEILDYINIILYKKVQTDYKNIKYIEYVEETKKRLKSNANFNMSIDNLIFNIWNNK